MTKTERLLCGSLGLLAAAGLGATILLSQQISGLQTSYDQVERSLRTLVSRTDGIESAVGKQIAGLEQRDVQRTGQLQDTVRAVGKAPDPADIAKIILQQSGDQLVQNVAKALVADPAAAAALRGRDADPALVAKTMAEGAPLAAIIVGVQKRLWEARRHDILMDPELIATIAAKVYDTYGAELSRSAGGDRLAQLIARELSNEPAFAALVAAMRTP